MLRLKTKRGQTEELYYNVLVTMNSMGPRYMREPLEKQPPKSK